MNTIFARNVPHAYSEAIIKMRMWGVEEDSRNGRVITSEDPVLLQITNPLERVLFEQARDCNPFFHVMEVVWMLAGENDVRWIEQFNRGFRNFADPGSDILHAAYGYRWRRHFGRNQIRDVAELLRRDPKTRRAVIGMWDPSVDLDSHADLPCNTSIMFRLVGTDSLDMTVINRSNDLIWGMLGANAVHMTYLHELMAYMTDTTVGMYKVFTNNLHIYKDMPYFDEVWSTLVEEDYYQHGVEPYALLAYNESYEELVEDCQKLIGHEPDTRFKTDWMSYVAFPMYMAYMNRLSGMESDAYWIRQIEATDWRLACEQYVNRRKELKRK